MKIRSKTLKSWLYANFSKEELSDIAKYGCAGGFKYLTYYTDTCKLYEKFKDEIWEVVSDLADDVGQTPAVFISRLNGAVNIESAITFENLLVWFTVEEYARLATEAAE